MEIRPRVAVSSASTMRDAGGTDEAWLGEGAAGERYRTHEYKKSPRLRFKPSDQHAGAQSHALRQCPADCRAGDPLGTPIRESGLHSSLITDDVRVLSSKTRSLPGLAGRGRNPGCCATARSVAISGIAPAWRSGKPATGRADPGAPCSTPTPALRRACVGGAARREWAWVGAWGLYSAVQFVVRSVPGPNRLLSDAAMATHRP